MKNFIVKKSVELEKNELCEMPFDIVYDFKNGKAVARKGELYGLVDKNANVIISPIYDYIYPFQNKIAVVKKNRKYGAIKDDGTILIKPQYEYYKRDFSDGIGVFKNKSQASFLFEPTYEVLIDESGSVIKELFNMESDPFLENAITVISDGKKYGLINRKGNEIIEPQSKYIIHKVYNDVAIMQKENNFTKRYIVDKTGKKHKFFDYEDVEILENNLFHVQKNKKHFLTDIYNNKISRDYDYFECIFGAYIAGINQRYYIVDSLGNEVSLLEDYNANALLDEKIKIIEKVIPRNTNSKEKNGYIPSDYEKPNINVYGDTVVADYKYIGKTCNLKLKYIITISKSDGSCIIKTFKNQMECDMYYKELIGELEKYNAKVDAGINKVYKDADDSLEKFLKCKFSTKK